MSIPQQQFDGFQLDFPATLDDARNAIRSVIEWLADQQILPDECRQWELVLAEAANNAVNYATPEQSRLTVRIEAILSAQDIEARITDHTSGFDWPNKVELPEDDERDHGRGLFIISSLTDDVSYLRGKGHNVLFLRSRRKAPALPPQTRCAKQASISAPPFRKNPTVSHVFTKNRSRRKNSKDSEAKPTASRFNSPPNCHE